MGPYIFLNILMLLEEAIRNELVADEFGYQKIRHSLYMLCGLQLGCTFENKVKALPRSLGPI